MSKPPKIGFITDRHGQAVAYSEHGSGPLVICPGWWVSHVEKDWENPEFRDFFEGLGQGLRVVRFDRPGVGLSDRDVASRTFQDEVDLLGDIADAFGNDTYALMALSCAGPIAIAHAVRAPARVERIVFCGSYCDGPGLGSRSVQEAVRSIVTAHWGMGSRSLADIFYPDADSKTLNELAKQMRNGASAEMAAEMLQLSYDMDVTDLVGDLDVPCLVVHRDKDKAIPFEAGRKLATRLRNGRLVPVKGSAHPPWVDGEETAALANAFLHGREPNLAVEAEPMSGGEDPDVFNAANRCLRVDGEEIALTKLEFGVMKELVAARGEVVTRDALLERVWKQPFEGSNRVDVALSALRKKLGAWAPSVETVTGHGYRFVAWRRE